MARGRIFSSTLAVALVGGLLSSAAIPARAGSRDGAVIGAGAAGLAIGLLLSGAANSGAREQPQPNPGAKTYRRPQTRESSPARVTGTPSGYSRGELEKIQESLNLLGYDAGTVDGSMGRKTQQAILKYQANRNFTPTGHLSKVEQQVLLSDVAVKQRGDGKPQATASAPPGAGTSSEGGGESRSALPQDIRPDPRLEVTHWETVRNSRNAAEIEDYLKRYPNGQFMSVALLRLEQLKSEPPRDEDNKRKVEKADPPTANKDAAAQGALPVISDTSYPRAKQRRADAIGVIIGNSAYRNGVPSVEFGLRDAEAIKLLTMKTLGIDSSNIIAKQNATRAELDLIFGTEKDHKGTLWRTIDPDGNSDIVVYFSGHGAPGSSDSDGNFLLPVDGDPNHASLNGYPLSQLYKNLGELKARSITVFLAASFSGLSAGNNKTPLFKRIAIVEGPSKQQPSDASMINVFAAAGDRQLSSWDPEAGHGIFTRHLIAGLSGEADENLNKEITAKELRDYLGRQVKRTARRLHGRDQDIQFSGNPYFVLAKY